MNLINAQQAASDYVTHASIASADIVAELARLADSGEIDGVTASVTEYTARGALTLGYIVGPGNKLTEATQAASAGGIPEEGAWGAFGKITGVLGIVGDVATIIDPGDVSSGEKTWLRVAAASNAAGTVVVLAGDGTVTAVAGALGIDAAVGWVPVAGQAVVIATGVFLAGDYLYHHWKPAKVVIDAVGHGVKVGFDATVHGVESGVTWTVDGVESGLSAVGHFFGGL